MQQDCCFSFENKRFRYRVGCIIIEDGCVLMATNKKANYYYSIGGGVHMGESAEDAVVREVFEETGVHYQIDRLVFVHENFFVDTSNSAIKGFESHEVAFYFLMKPQGTKELPAHQSTCIDGDEFVEWIPIDKFHEYKAFPEFFAEKLPNINKQVGVEHIVTK